MFACKKFNPQEPSILIIKSIIKGSVDLQQQLSEIER